jgi:LysR family glycine cleavage system transcriptional activator
VVISLEAGATSFPGRRNIIINSGHRVHATLRDRSAFPLSAAPFPFPSRLGQGQGRARRPAPLNAIRVFVTAARLGSFQSAAKALFVTPGAVSRQIRALESHLEMQLFTRLPREAVLTKAGEHFLSQVGPALIVIEQACQQVCETTDRSVLRIESTPTFALYWLIPRLQQFLNDYPDMQVELSTAQGSIEHGKPAHLFIRRSTEHFAGLVANEFILERSLLVCNPDYLRHNDLSSADAVARSHLIMTRSRPDLWPKWLIQQNIGDSTPADRIEFDNTIFAIQAAMQGLGIAFIPMLFLDDALRSGALVPVTGFEPINTGAYYWLCQHPGRPTFVHAFIRWLEASVTAEEPRPIRA